MAPTPRITRAARGALAMAAVAATALALTGCTGAASNDSRLVIALDSDQAAFGYDPLRYGSGQRMFFEGVYDSLFTLDADAQVVPDLVTEFAYNEDKTELTLELDTSATFADGSTLSAELVKQNLDFRGDPDLSAYNGFAEGGETPIGEVVVVDEDTVTLVFPTASEGFEANLVFPAGAIVGPTGVADRDGLDSAADGSGPLQIDGDASVKGNTYLLTKKADHPDAGEYPFEAYEFRPITDPQARVNAVISGDVDFASVVPTALAQVESGGKSLLSNGGSIFNLLPFDKSGAVVPAFGDENVRRALSIAIDREAFVEGLYPGERPTASALPLDSPGYIAELEDEYAYDPELARELLAEAGYPDGFSFEFVVSGDSQRDLEAIQPYWEAIGVEVTLTNASSTEEIFAAVRTTPLGGPIVLTWTNPAGNIFGVLFGFANFHGAQNDAINGATGALLGAQDDASRESALQDLNRAIVDSAWLIPLYERESHWGYDSSKVSGATFPGAEPFPLLPSIQPAS